MVKSRHLVSLGHETLHPQIFCLLNFWLLHKTVIWLRGAFFKQALHYADTIFLYCHHHLVFSPGFPDVTSMPNRMGPTRHIECINSFKSGFPLPLPG